MITKQRGAVSLVTVSIMAFLMMTIALSMTRLMVGELRQSTDAENSIKSYYSAEGAAEYQAQVLRTALYNDPSLSGLNSQNQGCSRAIPAVLDNIKCIKVETSANQVEDNIPAEHYSTFDLSKSVVSEGDNIFGLRISWDDSDLGSYPPTFTDSGDCRSGTDPTCTWQAGSTGQPPVLELTVTNYFPNQSTNIDNSKSGTVILNPRTIGSTPTYGNCSPVTGSDPPSYNFQTCILSTGNNPVVQVKCQGNVYPRCRADFTNVAPAGYRTVISLKSRFRGSKYTLTAVSTNTYTKNCPISKTVQSYCQVPVALDRAKIDVTAGIGQAYRRIIMSVPIRAIPSTPALVLEGDSDICKSFDVYDSGGSQFARVTTLAGSPACLINN